MKSVKRICSAAAIAAAATILTTTGCAPKTQPAEARTPPPDLRAELFSGSNALEEVAAFIAIGPRASGSSGMRQAAVHLSDRLDSIGLTPETITYNVETPAGALKLNDVCATIPGRGDGWIVLISHTDTKDGISDTFCGANDSGSSTGLLLAIAEHLVDLKTTLQHSILFAFVDGEECRFRYGPRDGLHGSKRLAAQLVDDGRAKKTVAVIVADMIGDKDLNITIPVNSSPELLIATLKAARKQKSSSVITRGKTSILDDHQPFLDAGMPAIDLIDFTYGSAPGRNNYWHTPQDTLDKLSAQSLELTGRILLQLIADLQVHPE